MNKRCFIYLNLVLVVLIHQSSALTSSVKAAAHLEQMLKQNPACKQIKCPSYSDPMCVRLKYVTSALEANTVYVLMVNRCEIKYVTCYEGVVAKEVPMKYCDHGKNILDDLKKLQERRRLKQTVLPVVAKSLEEKNKNKTGTIAAGRMPAIIRRKRSLSDHSHTSDDDVQAEIVKSEIAKRDKEQQHIEETVTTTQKDPIFYMYMKDGNGGFIKAWIDNNGTIRLPLANKLQNKPGGVAGENGDIDGKDIDNNEPRDNDQQGDISDRIEYVIHSGEEKLEDVNMEQYSQQCPTTCPARGVMSCAKCKDGIYRTFLSPCHMRMFDCGHPEEKLTVVAWAPCAMSGPYLEDLRVPVGRIDEPNDDDVVLRYLKCMEYGSKNLKPYSRLNCTEFDGLKKQQNKNQQTVVPEDTNTKLN